MVVSSVVFQLFLSFFLSRPAVAATSSYVLDSSYSGSNFFGGWNFWTVRLSIESLRTQFSSK
jgi:hypothetical protein